MLLVFLIRADSSRKEFLATSCDRQPVVFSEEDPSSPKPDEGRYERITFTLKSPSIVFFRMREAAINFCDCILF